MMPRIVVERVESRTLAANPLGDPATRELAVYLPPSYDKGNTTFPVVYCLAGFTGSARTWFNFHAWVPAMDERLDLLFAAGVPEMIAVFPDCFTRYGEASTWILRRLEITSRILPGKLFRTWIRIFARGRIADIGRCSENRAAVMAP